jgi:hypothetical protein
MILVLAQSTSIFDRHEIVASRAVDLIAPMAETWRASELPSTLDHDLAQAEPRATAASRRLNVGTHGGGRRPGRRSRRTRYSALNDRDRRSWRRRPETVRAAGWIMLRLRAKLRRSSANG